MSTQSLISVLEVIASAPVSHNYDPGLLCQFIKDGEYKLCIDCCFGENFYLHLLDDLKPGLEDYNDCKDYDIGDLVIFGALTYEATGNPEAGESPETNPNLWMVTSKFNNTDYTELYNCHLRELLAFCILHSSIISTAIQVSSVGVMKNSTDYSQSAEDETVLLLKSDLQNRIETRRDFMDKYLTRINESLGINNVERFPLYPANEETLCNTGCKCALYKDPVNIPMPGRKNKKYNTDNCTCGNCS